MKTFAGQLTVKDKDFEARFERLIIDGQHLSFRLEALEPNGDHWHIDARASLRDGQYVARPVWMEFHSSGEQSEAAMAISANITDEGCVVSVQLNQFGEGRWRLEGTLHAFEEAAQR